MFPWSPKPKQENEKTESSSTTMETKKLPPGYHSPKNDSIAVVTGACGLCGARLVEMLLQRNTQIVIAIDIQYPTSILKERFNTIQQQTGNTIIECFGPELGDITNLTALRKAFDSVSSTTTPTTTTSSSSKTTNTNIQIVYHIAALVGPFYDKQLYYNVNYIGTKHIIQLCQEYNILKLVYSSSPGTRFTGVNIEGLQEEDLPIPKKFLATYAETKAMGEIEVTNANNNHTLFTISIAPHQIYGPYDNLFLNKFLEVCGNNRLRIFGTGQYLISICYVDNYCHGLMCGADTLQQNSITLGKFYIITDGNVPRNLWNLINEASIAMGFTDLHTKFHLPIWLLYIIATFGNIFGYIFNIKFKLNYFSLRMSTMHRYFNISNAIHDLHYEPIVPFEQAWPLTIQWFQQYWLPSYLEQKNIKNKNTSSTTTTTKSKES